MNNNVGIKKEKFRRVVLKNVDKFNGISNREDAEFFLNNIFIEGDIYITFNKRKKLFLVKIVMEKHVGMYIVSMGKKRLKQVMKIGIV